MVRSAKLCAHQKYHLDTSNIEDYRQVELSAMLVNRGKTCDIIIQRGESRVEILKNGDVSAQQNLCPFQHVMAAHLWEL